MLWKQNTCQKCLDNRLDLSIDWSSLDCHQLSSNPSSIIYFLSLFLRQTEHQLEMLTFENQPKVHLDLLSSRFWFQPVQIRSPKNSPPSAFDKSTIQIFLPLGIQASGNLNISLRQVWLQEQRLQGYANYIWRFCTIGQACVLHCTIYLILRGRQYILCWESATADNLLASSRVNPSLLTLSESVKALIVIIIIVMVNDHWSWPRSWSWSHGHGSVSAADW